MVVVDNHTILVSGPAGKLSRSLHSLVEASVTPEGVSIRAKGNTRLAKALSGTFASHIQNMIAGVEKPYTKSLILEGVGYKVELRGTNLVFSVGFSHQVTLPIPQGVTAAVEKNAITLTSPDKDLIGQFAANVRAVRPPEPYLGKGIRYTGEVIRRKQGKKAV